jgi:hypothetical protein
MAKCQVCDREVKEYQDGDKESDYYSTAIGIVCKDCYPLYYKLKQKFNKVFASRMKHLAENIAKEKTMC